MDRSALLRELAQGAGVAVGYHDIWGEHRTVPDATLEAVLTALGLPTGDPAQMADAIAGIKSGTWQRAHSPTPEGTLLTESAPPRGHVPSALLRRERLWGINIALYGLRSQRNWGVGDFGDLRDAVDVAASLGADFVGLLPLHATFNDYPFSISPYYPSSRLFLNPAYICVDDLKGEDSASLNDFMESPFFSEERDALRETSLVRYDRVWALKENALLRCFDDHKGDSAKMAAYGEWRGELGEELERFATFCALREHLAGIDGNTSSWRDWPDHFATFDSPQVAAFRQEHCDEVAFHGWLQWVADGQLGGVAGHAARLGLEVGLYLDVALGVDPGGADAWSFQELLALDVSAGCPPDPFSLLGQRWGLPPVIPHLHRSADHVLLRDTISSNAGHAGAIRIDHAAGLARLFWIPQGMEAAQGAYVADDLEENLAVLRSLSRELECAIIGEDLGTVPEEVRRGLDESGFFSYRLAMFERVEGSRFPDPAHFPENSLISFATHDLPTLDGWWLGRDLAVKEELGRYPDDQAREGEISARERDREALLQKLKELSLLEDDFSPTPLATREELDLIAVAVAVHAYLARSSSGLFLANLDDLVGEWEMQNLPGTLDEHPNWRRKCSLPLEQWSGDERLTRIAAAIRNERAGSPR